MYNESLEATVKIGTVVEGPFNGSQIFTMVSLGEILHFLTDSTKFLLARLAFI